LWTLKEILTKLQIPHTVKFTECRKNSKERGGKISFDGITKLILQNINQKGEGDAWKDLGNDGRILLCNIRNMSQ
jgi:hypothetical protein